MKYPIGIQTFDKIIKGGFVYIDKTAPLILALCLTSCSSSLQDDLVIPEPTPTPQPSQVSIGFGGNSGSWEDAPTRATTTRTGLEELFPSFKVWGYKTAEDATTTNTQTSQVVMDGYHVKYEENTAGSTASNTGDWEYVGISSQTIKYWDYSAADYRFFAYSPADAKVSDTSPENGGTATHTFSVPYEYSKDATATSVPYVSDLWYSDNNTSSDVTSSGQYGKSVTLTFAPLVSKVRFKFSYPDGTTEVEITDIRFRDSRFMDDETTATTPLKGNLIATYPQIGKPTSTSQSGTTVRYAPEISWRTSATGSLVLTIPYEDKSDAIHILADENLYAKWYYVPPLGILDDFQQGPYTITANINGNETSATVPAAYMQWKVGFQYTYIFKITQAGTDITFDELQVEQWLPGENIDNNGSGTIGW